MGIIDTILTTLKNAGAWAAKNPEKAMQAVYQVESLCSGKSYEPSNQADRILVAEQRLNQLNEKTEKTDRRLDALYGEVQAMGKQVRKLRIWLTVTGVALALALGAIAVFAFWL